mgnify:CR=1 FL=1
MCAQSWACARCCRALEGEKRSDGVRLSIWCCLFAGYYIASCDVEGLDELGRELQVGIPDTKGLGSH